MPASPLIAQSIAVVCICLGIVLTNAYWLVGVIRGREARRNPLMAIISTVAALWSGAVYASVLLGNFPTGLPPEWGRPVVLLMAGSVLVCRLGSAFPKWV